MKDYMLDDMRGACGERDESLAKSAYSSDGQSDGFLTRRPQVQILLGAPDDSGPSFGVAQNLSKFSATSVSRYAIVSL